MPGNSRHIYKCILIPYQKITFYKSLIKFPESKKPDNFIGVKTTFFPWNAVAANIDQIRFCL